MNKLAKTLNPRDLSLIRNFLLGGAALGGAAGVGTSLANYFNTLKKEQPQASDDDDVLYLRMPQSKMALEKEAVVGGGLALAGGTLATIGSYALARRMYQAIKRKRIQEELDKAQTGYLDTVDTEAKSASDGKPMSFTELATSIPVALPLLMGVGSGVLAHKALDQAFPSKRRRLKTGPRKIVLLRPGEEPPLPEEGQEDPVFKQAAYDPDDGMEFLVGTVLSMSKRANDLSDMVAALALGRSREMRALASDYGTPAMLDMVKGASMDRLPEPQMAMAVSFAVKSAEFGPVTKLLAAAEFADACPQFFKIAGHVDEDTAEALTGILSLLGAAIRHDTFTPYVKRGGMVDPAAPQGINPQLLELLLELQRSGAGRGAGQLLQGATQGEQPNAQHDEHLSDVFDSEMSTAEPGADRDNASDDMIDSILSGNDDEMEGSSEEPVEEEKHRTNSSGAHYNTPEA